MLSQDRKRNEYFYYTQFIVISHLVGKIQGKDEQHWCEYPNLTEFHTFHHNKCICTLVLQGEVVCHVAWNNTTPLNGQWHSWHSWRKLTWLWKMSKACFTRFTFVGFEVFMKKVMMWLGNFIFSPKTFFTRITFVSFETLNTRKLQVSHKYITTETQWNYKWNTRKLQLDHK